jgi:uncharacterized surface protein with fasciclin (FAS1) repeats
MRVRKAFSLLLCGALALGLGVGASVAAESPTKAAKSEKAATAEAKDIVATISSHGNFKTMAELITKADLADMLKGEGPFTVFAPTDEAFAAMGKQKLAKLSEDPAALKAFLMDHIAKGRISTEELANMKAAKMMGGADPKVEAKEKALMVAGAKVVMGNIAAKNGVIHAMDKVIMSTVKNAEKVEKADKKAEKAENK